MKNLNWIAIVGIVVWIQTACNHQTAEPKQKSEIQIACAANMQFAMDSIVMDFERETGIKCEVHFGATGILATQILNGAPYDLFIAADTMYPHKLFAEKKGYSPETYAYGQLIMVANQTRTSNELVENLMDENVKRIGIADPQTAPYGKAAVESLKSLRIWEKIQPKIVVCENIGQVNAHLKAKAIDVGFTNFPFVKNTNGYMNYIVVANELHAPIEQRLMVLTAGKNQHEAEAFANFMKKESTVERLINFGYLAP